VGAQCNLKKFWTSRSGASRNSLEAESIMVPEWLN
jgi:hypothetical protein